MNILTVIPTQKEFDAFVEVCLGQHPQGEIVMVGKLSTTYFPTLELSVALGGLGKTRFAVQTQHLIDAGQWDVVICAGAAGALIAQICVGDVVIGTETIEHDIRKLGKPLIPCFHGAKQILDTCRQALPTASAVRVHYGPIASGDEDVMDGVRRAEIHERTQALAVAWEGAGGAQASQFSGLPFLEIRGIVDQADHKAAHDFSLHLKRAMGNVARVILSLARIRQNHPI